MGLFDKKYCDVCGQKIGLLGNRKLDDGNLCKDCAAKLSPFFSDRRHATVAEIKAQLADREANRARVEAFATTRTIGDSDEIMLDEHNRRLIVHRKGASLSQNPDVLDFDQVTGCELKVEHSKTELKDKDPDGKSIPFDPPRHKHTYGFYVLLHVQHPWFDEIRMRLNSGSVEILTGMPVQLPGLLSQIKKFTPDVPDTAGNADYQHYQAMGEEICAILGGAAAAPVEIEEPVEENSNSRVCAWCGATFTPDSSGKCPYCGGAQ